MPYENSAEWYDLIYRWKDYRAEVNALRGYFARYESRPTHTILDVACGTGAHLVHLNDHYTCTGLDYSPDMLRVARAKLPDLPIHEGDMRTFDLGMTFDVVLCLFSAIGYMHSTDDLHKAVATMAQHVAPGGMLIFDGWFTPEQYTPGRLSMLTVDEPEIKLVRMSVSEIRGRLSVMDMHHLVATREGGTRHFIEHHELHMFTEDEYAEAVRAAGLGIVVDPQGLMNRGLYIGIKPL